MGFSMDLPNDKGSRPGYGGVAAPESRGGFPSPPNDSPGGDRNRDEGAKKPPVGAFPSPPNEHAGPPGYGGVR